MGAARRLQQEIDAVLKKVKEGVSTFDDTYEKVCVAASSGGGSIRVSASPSWPVSRSVNCTTRYCTWYAWIRVSLALDAQS